MSDNVFDIGIGTDVNQSGVDKGLKDIEKKLKDSAKKQSKTIGDANKKNAESFKDFAKSAAQELLGIDQLVNAMAGGPAALGKAVVDMGKKAVAALNEMAEKWRAQEKLEIALQKAAQNNPYLNERAVRQLKEFANEMQKITGIDSDLVLESETKLARLGRSQQQIQQIIQTATNVAATGMMGYDEAIMELNGSLNGVIRTSGRLFPELKSLSQEALAAGEAINIVAGKVNGAAAEAMQTGAGSVTAYQNAIADLKKTLGEDWEKNTGFIREAITQIANEFVRGREEAKKFKEAVNNIKEGTGDVNDELIITEKKLRDLYALFNTEIVMLAINSQQVLENMKNGVDIAIEAHTTAKREFLENLRRQIRQEEALLKTQEERAVILNTINDAIEKINKAQLIVGEDNLIIIEAQRKVLDVQQGIKKFLDMGMTEQAKAYQGMAEQAAIAAANEATRVEKQREIEAGSARFREENQKALDAEIAKILRKAEIEGKSRNDLQVQKQILDAQVQAYENLLSAAKEFIDGTAPEERARFARLKETWAAYDERAERERVIDEERKRRLAELAGVHEETKAKIIRIFDDIYKERDRLFDVQAEQDHQAQLEELIKNSLKRSIDFETQYRTEQAKTQQQIILENFDEEYNRKIDQVISMRETEMEQYAEGSAARLAAEKALLEEIDRLTLEYQNDRETLRVQLEENTAAQIVQIERDAAEAVTAAWQTAWNEALSAAQKYFNAASSIANSISTMWHNSIDYETNERLRANDKMVQSDEERAANEKKIMMESAYEKYKADMFIWSANIALATANAAMAVLNALSTQPWYAGLANSIIAGSLGAFQVAAVISAQPKPPRFHTGGIAQGAPGQEVPAILRAGEPVLTQDQFGNVMKAFANVANSRYGGGGTNLVVNVKNSAANVVNTEQKLSPEGLEIVITQIVKKNLSNGGLDEGLALQRSHAGGINITS
jgi:hypothetical protein